MTTKPDPEQSRIDASASLTWYKTIPSLMLQDRDIECMSLGAIGLHTYLLWRSWVNNGIPIDIEQIHDLAHLRRTRKSTLKTLWEEICSCWPVAADGTRRVNQNQENDRKEARARHERSRKAGVRSSEQRTSATELASQGVDIKESTPKQSSAVISGLVEPFRVEENTLQESTKETSIPQTPSPSALSIAKRRTGEMSLNAEQQAWWDEFWNEGWPKNRRVDRIRAQKAFFAYVTDNGKFEDVMMGLAMTLPSWETKESRFIPHPATWLNGHRWEDAPEEVPLFQFKTNGDR